ncbi:MAG: ferritin family protein [Syntrophobacterales bacterium]|jgi:rubrerythrin|nr:ferritin family protein [Syntrophobacterales bacterium]
MSTELEAIIKSAIAQEELSREFYLRLAGLVSHADTKDMLEFLAKDELEHKAFLQSCFTPQGCKLAGAAQNAHLAEMLAAPAITDDISPKEALVIAMKREEGSYRFYQTLAELQPPGEIQDFLNKMAKVELQHKEKVEYLYDNAAFPEIW